MANETVNPLIPLGIGIGVGALSLFALIELFPLFVVGGAGYLIYKGLGTEVNTEEADNVCDIGQRKK